MWFCDIYQLCGGDSEKVLLNVQSESSGYFCLTGSRAHRVDPHQLRVNESCSLCHISTQATVALCSVSDSQLQKLLTPSGVICVSAASPTHSNKDVARSF